MELDILTLKKAPLYPKIYFSEVYLDEYNYEAMAPTCIDTC